MVTRKDRFHPANRWKKVGSTLGKILLWTLLFITCIGTLAVGVGFGVVSAIVKDQPVMNKKDFQKQLDGLVQTSFAYFQNKDANGTEVEIGTLRSGDERLPITKLEEVNPLLQKAFISMEDWKFYEHNGIRPTSIARAAWQQLTNADAQTGGSTITQQLVKLIILQDRRQELDRKAKEMVLSLRIEKMFSKNEIYLYYLNSVYFGDSATGRNMYGVSSAAKGLFNKDQKDLNLPQAAYIAGMVQRPNDYNPFKENSNNIQLGIKRMKLVLDEMLEHKTITKQQYDEALRFDLVASFAKPETFENGYERYPFIMYAVETQAAELLMKLDGLNPDELSKQGKYKATLDEYKQKATTGGYRFYTTVDENLYNKVNEAALKNINIQKRTYKGKKMPVNVGAVVLDNKTGAILAFVSGSEKFSANQRDHALNVTRQPGSTIKPLLDYGPALEEGLISPGSKIVDEELRKADGSGTYQNANKKYQGPVTVSEALKWSYNIPAIKTFQNVGQKRAFSYIQKMGLTPHKNDGESSSIGGFTYGFTVQEMTAAYSTLANGGKYNEPYLISKITDAAGNIIWEHKVKPVKVFSPQTSYQLSSMLQNVLNGTATYTRDRIQGNFRVAGKTGTTNDDKDLWFVGYTPNISIGTWGGFDYPMEMGSSMKYIAQQTWINVFNAATKARPDLFPKSIGFSNPGNLPGTICGFDCGNVAEYEQKKAEEEAKKKAEEDAKKPPVGDPNYPPPNPDDPGSGTRPPVKPPILKPRSSDQSD